MRYPPWPSHLAGDTKAQSALDWSRKVSKEYGAKRCAGVMFLIDECLSPALTLVANHFGYVGHHVRDRGWQGLKDHELCPQLLANDLTLVTNDRDDWRELLGNEPVHPGLVVLIRRAEALADCGLHANTRRHF